MENGNRAADVTFHANLRRCSLQAGEEISKTDFQMQHLTIYHLIVIGELKGGWGGGCGSSQRKEEVERISLHNQIC